MSYSYNHFQLYSHTINLCKGLSMCNCCVIVILFEELFKSSVTVEVEVREAEKGE